MSKIPEGSTICSIVAISPTKCIPTNGEDCESWKTFGVLLFRITLASYDAVIYPLCKKHMHVYVDDVLYSSTTNWGDATPDVLRDEDAED